MSTFPFTHLFQGASHSVLASGPHLLVIETKTGVVVNSTAALESPETDSVLNSDPIRYCAVDEKFEHAATAGDDKKLKVWQIDGLKLLSERELPKKTTDIRFTRDGQTILVSDKFGDVWSYPLEPAKSVAPPSLYVGSSKRGALTSHENPSNGTLILGHASLLTSFILTSDEKFIITADRDEHIRVSWYPKGYVVESYCLGHEKFVSAIHIPSFAPSVLISGGGDPTLKIWDWMSGKLLSEIPILDTLEPYIKVKAPKGKREREDGENEDGDEVQRNIGRRKKSRKGKGKVQEQGQLAEEEGEDRNLPGDNQNESSLQPEDASIAAEGPVGEARSRADTPLDSEDTGPATRSERTVLVLQRILSVDLSSSGHRRQLIFSAVGATALCYCAFPDVPASSSSSSSPPEVRLFDLGRPVVDFMLDADNRVWVFLDPNWNGGEASPGENAIKLLTWVGEELTEATDSPSLLTSLRGNLFPATADDLKVLDLYSPLATMPKNVDPEYDSMKRDHLSDVLAEPAGTGSEKQLTQRELARLKKKRALALKVQNGSVGAATQTAAAVTPEPHDATERSGKKAKSEGDDDLAAAKGTSAKDVSSDNMDVS